MIRRKPDFVIGDPTDPYMLRWWLIPRNRWFNVYLHHMRKDDDDRALHDHPWSSLSICIGGRLREHLRDRLPREIGVGRVVFRRAKFAHRLEIIRPAWTIFITGPRVREWGFYCPKGWRHWQEFTNPVSKGEIGRGCE